MTEVAPRRPSIRTQRACAGLLLAIGAAASAGCGGTPAREATPDVTALVAMCGPEPAMGLPADVFCTGLYAGHDASKHASDVQPYLPGVTLWSDGAEKQRYLYLPKGTRIDTSDMDVWKFPVGTKAWKEFRFGGKLVETRLFWKRDASTWEFGTYIWDAANTAAALNASPKPTVLATGYEIPTVKDCDKCHHGGADKLLGVEAVALSLPTANGVTLESLAHGNWLSAPPGELHANLPEDATGRAGAALGYLHANCGMPCHSTRGLGEETKLVLRIRAGEIVPVGGAAPTGVDARSTDMFKATVGQMPTTASVVQQFPGAERVVPGHHDQSLVWLLPHRRGNYQMPPLVTHVVDDAGTQKVADWIDALTP